MRPPQLPQRAAYPYGVNSIRIARHIRAPRAAVYRALLDARAVATWRVPTGMSSVVHEFDAREGGSFRISLTYDAPTGTGKTTAHTDTYHGRFVKVVPNEQVVEVEEFETTDPALRGEMTMALPRYDMQNYEIHLGRGGSRVLHAEFEAPGLEFFVRIGTRV